MDKGRDRYLVIGCVRSPVGGAAGPGLVAKCRNDEGLCGEIIPEERYIDTAKGFAVGRRMYRTQLYGLKDGDQSNFRETKGS